MPRYLVNGPIALALAVAAPLAVCVALLPWRGSLANTNVALILVVVVVAVAALGRRLAGALAALSAAVWFDFFFTVPYQRLTINSPDDVTTAVLLLAVGLAVSQLAARARRLRLVAITDAGYLAELHQAAHLAQTSRSADVVVEHVRAALIPLLGLRGCRFEYGSLVGHPPRIEDDGSVTAGLKRWDVERDGMPSQEVELRVFGTNHQFHGRYLLAPAPGAKPSPQARLVAVTLASQAGSALDNQGEPGRAR